MNESVFPISKNVTTTFLHEDGKFFIHNDPDVDALFGLWIVYHFVNKLFSVSPSDFLKKVELRPAGHKTEYPCFGIDIGTGISDTNVKESDEPWFVGGKMYNNACASMYLAYNLLTKEEFEGLQDIIVAIHNADTKGNPFGGTTHNQTSIWGILGAVQDNSSLDTLFTVVDSIFKSSLQSSIDKKRDMIVHLKGVQMKYVSYDKYHKYSIAIPPINAGRHVGQRCFRELYANVVVFSSYNEVEGTGTIGVSGSHKFSEQFHMNTIVNDPVLTAFMHDTRGRVFISDHVVGKTDKSPFRSSKNKILEYQKAFLAAVINLIGRGPTAAQDAGRSNQPQPTEISRLSGQRTALDR